MPASVVACYNESWPVGDENTFWRSVSGSLSAHTPSRTTEFGCQFQALYAPSMRRFWIQSGDSKASLLNPWLTEILKSCCSTSCL